MCGKGLTNGGEWWYYGGIKNAARRVLKRNIAVSPFCFSPWCAFYQINSKHKASPAHKLPRWPEEAE
jgi:hypothetical protein